MSAQPGRQGSTAIAILAVVSAGSLANGCWMVFAPHHWFRNLPAAIPDYGPFNPHFVRDVGVAFLTMGAALAWATVRVAARFELVAVAALFAALHAVLHVFDTATGHVGAAHWMLDLPGVYFPAIVLVAVAGLLRGIRRR